MRVATKVLVVACVFTGITTVVCTGVLVLLHQQRESGLLVNLAGRQRMLTQRMTKETLEILQASTPEQSSEATARLASTVKLFDETLHALHAGGETSNASGERIELKPVESRQAQAALLAGLDRWAPLHSMLNSAFESDSPPSQLRDSLPMLLEHNVPLLKEMNAATVELQRTGDARRAAKARLVVGGAVATITIGIGLVFYLQATVVRRVQRVRDRMAEIADGDGDLTVEVASVGNDEIADLAKSFNTFLAKVRQIVVSVNGVADQVSEAATTLAQASRESASALSDQQREVSALAGSVSDVSRAADSVVDEAGAMLGVVGDAVDKADASGAVAADLAGDMDVLVADIENSVSSIERLTARSEEIGRVTDVINEIAEQTNLLALNAAIEAARAGEHGRGFAVVADEVRKLADRTTTATSEIADSVRNIQNETEGALEQIRTSGEATRRGVRGARSTSESLASVSEMVRSLRTTGGSVSSAATGQASHCASLDGSMQTIAGAITNISNVVTSTGESVALLADKSVQLQDMMRRFNVHAPDRRVEEPSDLPAEIAERRIDPRPATQRTLALLRSSHMLESGDQR
ncbi:MAG: methyl-accepting chemotaxis protein [Planctomycetota bacterium]